LFSFGFRPPSTRGELQVIRGILKVSDPSDVPQSRLERYWREIDLDGSGTVDFEEFVIWMLGGTRSGTWWHQDLWFAVWFWLR
jgi:Ca2+-binding EF-hand superfamily protein